MLRQLERRLKEQILEHRRGSSASDKQALVKLERDFERVQVLAESYKSKVSRQLVQFQQNKSNSQNVVENNSAAVKLQENHTRFQMQVQEDVRNLMCPLFDFSQEEINSHFTRPLTNSFCIKKS